MKSRRISIESGLWATFVGLLLFTVWRVLIYASGQDSLAYTQIAQDLIYRPDGWKAALDGWLMYGPGWTFALAIARVLFGSLAAYWVAPLAFIGLQVLVYRFYRRFVARPMSALAATVFTTWLLINSFDMSPYFLLYPFRGSLCYFLVFLAYALVGTAEGDTCPWKRILLASFCFAYAILVRETMIFTFASMLLFLVWGKKERRGKDLLVFVAPFLIPTLLFVVSVLITGSFGTEQLNLWWRFLSRRYENGMWDVVAYVAMGQLRFYYEALSWWGILFVVVGLVKFGRKRSTVCLLLLPAVLLFVFYSLYEVPHRRYLLSSLVFAVPFAGLGMIYLAETMAARLKVPRLDPALAMVVICMALLGIKVSRLGPLWGVKVNAAEIKQLKQHVASFTEEGDALVTGWYYLHLCEGLVAHTPHTLLREPTAVRAHMEAGGRCFFLRPVDPDTPISKSRPDKQLLFETGLRHLVDLQPVFGADGKPVQFDFLGYPYEVLEVEQWGKAEAEQSWKPRSGADRFLWFNFRAGRGKKTIEVACGSLEPFVAELRDASGYAVVALPETFTGKPIDVKVKSERGVPSAPVIGFQSKEKFVQFELGRKRERAVAHWFPEPFFQFGAPMNAVFIAKFKEEATMKFPQVVGEVGQMDLSVAFSLETLSPGSGKIEFLVAGEVVHEDVFDTAREQHRSYLTLPDQGEELTFRVTSENADFDGVVVLHRVGYRFH